MDDIISFRTWFLKTIIGYFVGNFLLLILYSVFGADAKLVQFPVAIAYGAGIGFLQLSVLRRLYNVNMVWVFAYLIGLFVPFVFVDFAVLKFEWNWSLEIINVFKMISGGILVGFFHAKILKRLKYRNTYVYAVANIVAWSANASLVNYNNYLQAYFQGDDIFLLLNGFTIIIMGVILAFLNALSLHYIQHHDAQYENKTQKDADTMEY